MTLKTTYSENLTMLKTSNMQPAMISNRFILGIVAFSVSFGLTLVPNWDFNKAFFTGLITGLTIYAVALFVDKRRRNYEMLALGSLRKRIKEMEGLKSRVVREINQIAEHRSLLYAESQQLQNQILECRNQRDSLHRDLGNFAGQKKQLESEISSLKTELNTLEKSKAELNDAFSILTTEKRRLELNCHSFRFDITQLETQMSELQQEKQEIDNNLTLLGRIKPQLEEKMYELRIEVQELEVEINNQRQLLIATIFEKENIATNLNFLQTQKIEQQSQLQQLQSEFSLLQEERDLLQSQVWELLQQVDIFNQDHLAENIQEEDIDLFPFSELLETWETTDTISENLPEEWTDFLVSLPGHEIQILKAILEQDNIKGIIKQIAEANITMPNLLIDSINERASDIIGELIIEPGLETPEVYPEHVINVRKLISMHENMVARHVSSN